MAKRSSRKSSIIVGATIEETIVPDHVVTGRRNLIGIKRAMNKIYGEGEWGNEEVRAYLAERAWRKQHPKGDDTPTATSLGPAKDLEAQRVEEIMKTFDFNEAQLPTVKQLAAFEVGLEGLTEKFRDAVLKGDVSRVRLLQQAMTPLSREIRQTQQTLRIDVGSVHGEGVSELRKQVIDTMDRARSLLQEHAVRLECPSCQTSQTATMAINYGFLLFHFRNDVPWHMWFQCVNPTCKQGVHILGGPNTDIITFNGPERISPQGT